MKSFLGLLSIISLTRAGYPAPPGPWTMGAWRPPTDDRPPMWLGVAIQANAGRFWIGKPPSAYCPPDVSGLNCTAYPGDSTVFTGGNDTIFLNVAVPGGQQVYIAPDGALSYTSPHSASTPEGSILSGWTREISDAGGAPTVLGYQGRPVIACPAGENIYQVFIKLNDADLKSPCIWFELRSYTARGIVAWEY